MQTSEEFADAVGKIKSSMNGSCEPEYPRTLQLGFQLRKVSASNTDEVQIFLYAVSAGAFGDIAWY